VPTIYCIHTAPTIYCIHTAPTICCTGPLARILELLTSKFDADHVKDRRHSLKIQARVNGSELSHGHRTQNTFVLQTLALWLEIARNMYRLWQAAEEDMLSEDSYYRFADTGQGFNRLHV
jgi:hypothetical protein